MLNFIYTMLNIIIRQQQLIKITIIIEMSIIPNVSSVYRDLSHIYTTSGLNPKAQQQSSYSLQPKLNNYVIPFQQMYSYKQKRHNQLMFRLQNSYQEHQRIIGNMQGEQPSQQYSSISRNQGNIGSYDKNQYSFHKSYNQNSHSFVNNYSSPSSYQTSRNRNSNFVMPKIKYRHIQDQKQKSRNTSTRVQRNSNMKNAEVDHLQKQFYQDNNPNQNYKNKSEIERQVIGIQTQDQGFRNFQEDQKSMISNKTGGVYDRTSKNVKYQDKIESYYELCRKNINNKNEEIQKPKQEKFMRGTGTKNKVMKLDQAIKLLSID